MATKMYLFLTRRTIKSQKTWRNRKTLTWHATCIGKRIIRESGKWHQGGCSHDLLYGGGTQILAQASEIAAIFVVVGGLTFIFFKVLNALNLLRSAPAHELMGLDMPEMGALGYSNIDVHMPGVRLTHQVPGVGSVGRR